MGQDRASGVPPLADAPHEQRPTRDSGVPPLSDQPPEQRPTRASGVPPLSDVPNHARPQGFFDPHAPTSQTRASLPHWRQKGAVYFTTFRLSDSVPQKQRAEWQRERREWMQRHSSLSDQEAERRFRRLFSSRVSEWLDAGLGSRILAHPIARRVVEDALRFFDSQRYDLYDFVVAPTHVHALVHPKGNHQLSDILHSWKSYSAHRILAKVRRGEISGRAHRNMKAIWMKESWDHLVRDERAFERISMYIQSHKGARFGSGGTGFKR